MLPPILRLSVAVLAVGAGFGSVAALFADGSIADRDYQITYSGYTNTTTKQDTTAFYTAFRAECVDNGTLALFLIRPSRLPAAVARLGPLNYHHNLDCVVSQSGPKIYAWCGGVEKDANGDTGSGPAVDFTELVCPRTKGCSITAEPVSPVAKYGSAAASSATAASSTGLSTVASRSSAAKKAAATSATATETEVATTPPTDSTLSTAIPSTATWSFASQASSVPALEYASAAAVSGSITHLSPSAAATTDEASSAASGQLFSVALVLGGVAMAALV
ncbi:hypothetical protein JCM10213_005992 [Rhodosporidiobolus nylandii]